MKVVKASDVPPIMGRIVQVVVTREFGRARLGFFGGHEDAGMVEVGFLDGSTRLIPFDGVQVAWPVPDAYRVIPQYPLDPTPVEGARVAVCSSCGFIGAWMVDVFSRKWFMAHAEDDGVVRICVGCWANREENPYGLTFSDPAEVRDYTELFDRERDAEWG